MKPQATTSITKLFYGYVFISKNILFRYKNKIEIFETSKQRAQKRKTVKIYNTQEPVYILCKQIKVILNRVHCAKNIPLLENSNACGASEKRRAMLNKKPIIAIINLSLKTVLLMTTH